MRRKYNEALQSDKTKAEYVLTLFGKLYAIERKVKDEALTGEAVLQLRRLDAIPVLDALQSCMREEYPKVLPKSPIARRSLIACPDGTS